MFAMFHDNSYVMNENKISVFKHFSWYSGRYEHWRREGVKGGAYALFGF